MSIRFGLDGRVAVVTGVLGNLGPVWAEGLLEAGAIVVGLDLPSTAPNAAFRELQASELYCPTCLASRPVRERLLLVLPDGELHEYRCAACATSLGTRTVRARSQSPVKITM